MLNLSNINERTFMYSGFYKWSLLGIILCINLNISYAQNLKSHTVRRGETIETITKLYGVTETALKEVNPSLTTCYVGLLLNIPQDVKQESNSILKTVNGLDSRYINAINLYDDDQYKKAGKIFSQLIKEAPFSELYYYRGKCYFYRGKYKSAIKDLSQAQSYGDLDKDKKQSCSKLLAEAKELRAEQLERRGEMWAGIITVTAATAGAVMTAKAQSEASKNNSSSISSVSPRSVSSYGASGEGEGGSVSTSSSGNSHSASCKKCFGNGDCVKCNGDGHYLDTSFGLSHEVKCTYCNGTGKCSSCNGTGKR